MNSAPIIDPTAHSHKANVELQLEAAQRLCTKGMGLLAGEVAVMRRGSWEGHRLAFWLGGIAGALAAIIGACVR